jgi:hypothetical protein
MKITDLRIPDIEKSPVWQYTNDDTTGELSVKPVRRLPVKSLTGKIIGTEVSLGNGSNHWAIIGNIDNENQRLNEHFVTLSFLENGNWFTLARYHDFDYKMNGPDALAAFLNISIDDLFPIKYDITTYAIGNELALKGEVTKVPREVLSHYEIIALAVP